MSRMFVAAPIAALFIVNSGCATVRVKEPAAETCVVSVQYLIGGREVQVKDGQAKLQGLLGDRNIAFLKSDRTLVYNAGIIQVEGGEVKDGKLVLKGLGLSYASDPIAGGKVRVPMPIGSKEFTYTGTCSVEDAALGAFALLKSEDETNTATSAAMN